LKCSRCSEEMQYHEKEEFWKCPSCGGEFWDDQEKLKEYLSEQRNREASEQLRKQLLNSIGKRYTEVMPTGYVPCKKKSSSKSGRKRKKPLKKRRVLLDL